MYRLKRLTVSALAMAAIVLAAPGLFGADGNDRNDKRRNPVVISMIDDCDPSDPSWAPIGGCLLRKGDVTAAEFGMLLRSPLYDNISPFDAEPGRFLVGHPSWRNEPSHLVVKAGREIRVRNDGGRPHTFTPVAAFGGGVVGGLNVGTQTAPGCAGLVVVDPGDRDKFIATGEGLQRFQCCFHPWMRATIRVVPKDTDDDN